MAAGESQEWMGEKKVGRGRRVGVSLGHDLY